MMGLQSVSDLVACAAFRCAWEVAFCSAVEEMSRRGVASVQRWEWSCQPRLASVPLCAVVGSVCSFRVSISSE